MSEQKIPNIIYIGDRYNDFMQNKSCSTEFISIEKIYDEQNKYLSEQYVNQLMDEKDIYLENSMGYQKQLLEWNEKLKNEFDEKDKEIEVLKKQREWISVGDRHPETSCNCLGILRTVFTIDVVVVSYDYDEEDFYPHNNITHWMPLPQPPKTK